MEDCFDAGAEDVDFGDEAVEVTTATGDVRAVREALEAKGYTLTSAQPEYVPTSYTRIGDPALSEKMTKLLDMLEDNDDVQNVWHNWEDGD